MTQSSHIFEDSAGLYHAAAERVSELAAEAIELRGGFHFALAGGSTPAELYRELARNEMSRPVQWNRVHIYFGDERCVPPDDSESNFRMARETLLDHVPIPPEQVHRIRGEDEPHAAAAAYDELLAETLPRTEEGWRPDLVLLGLGPDGHVASLFPETDILGKHKALAAAVFVPRLKGWRISMTLPTINMARHILLLVSGPTKAGIVRQALQEPAGRALPVQLLRPRGELQWFLDADAAQQLDREALR